MALVWDTKDPDEVLDYYIDWTKELMPGDTIATSNFDLAVASGVVINSQSFTGPITSLWLQGGTEGTVAIVHNRITTNQGRTEDQTVILPISSK